VTNYWGWGVFFGGGGGGGGVGGVGGGVGGVSSFSHRGRALAGRRGHLLVGVSGEGEGLYRNLRGGRVCSSLSLKRKGTLRRNYKVSWREGCPSLLEGEKAVK